MRFFAFILALMLVPLASAQRFVKSVNTYAQLIALNINDIHTNAFVNGRTTDNDGGQGLFVYDANSSAATNLGTIFKPTSYNGRWIRQWSGPVNAKWFGAAGTALVDDLSPLTNGIAVADTLNMPFFIPGGAYRISSTIDVPLSLQIYGEGWNQNSSSTIGTLITNAGTGAALRLVGDGTQNGSSPSIIRDLKITGHSGSTDGILLSNVQLPVVERCYVAFHGRAGIYVSAGIAATINECRIQGNTNNIVITNNATTTYIARCRIEDSHSIGAGVFIQGDNDGRITIEENQIESNDGKGIWINGQCLSVAILGNWFEGNLGTEDVYLQGAAAKFVGDFLVQGNRFNSSGVTTALRLDYASDGIVAANLFAQAAIVSFSTTANTQDILHLWNRTAGTYTDLGTRVIRQERGVTYELGSAPKLRGSLLANGFGVTDHIWMAGSDANRFFVGITNTAVGGGTTSRGLKVKVADNDATDIVLQLHNFNNTGTTLWGDMRLQHEGAINLTATISPAQITGNQNDYNPTGLSTATILRLSTDASRNVTGLQSTSDRDGRLLFLHNIGTQNLVLVDESASSAATNRFALTADKTLAGDESVAIIYDNTSTRWRIITQ